MSRAKLSGLTRVIARVTLVMGLPGNVLTVAPGEPADLPAAEAERLIANGHAAAVPSLDSPLADPSAA
jgi:hypothetical protein